MQSGFQFGALCVGLICAALGCWGAFEYGYRLEGGITYIALAAPAIAGAAALVPVFAEASFRSGDYLKGAVWTLALVPAGAVVFFASAERVHYAKAGAAAERQALSSQADRARQALAKAEEAAQAAQSKAAVARGQRECGPVCRATLAQETAALTAVDVARRVLLDAERQAVAEAPLKAPVWLLPAALDVVAFLGIWTGLSGFGRRARSAAPARRRRVRRAAEERRGVVMRPANSNVRPFPPAA